MLTTAQLTTLKAAILANPALTQYVADRRDDLIAAHYNEAASPAVTVWRSSVTRDEILGDGFDFTQVDNLTSGQARIFDWLFDNSLSAMNPSQDSKRAAISEAWKGTAAKVAVATYIFGKCKRAASRLEALFATGTGSVASPSVMAAEGEISVNQISDLLNAA